MAHAPKHRVNSQYKAIQSFWKPPTQIQVAAVTEMSFAQIVSAEKYN
jgi:hypothetical protein